MTLVDCRVVDAPRAGGTVSCRAQSSGMVYGAWHTATMVRLLRALHYTLSLPPSHTLSAALPATLNNIARLF